MGTNHSCIFHVFEDGIDLSHTLGDVMIFLKTMMTIMGRCQF